MEGPGKKRGRPLDSLLGRALDCEDAPVRTPDRLRRRLRKSLDRHWAGHGRFRVKQLRDERARLRRHRQLELLWRVGWGLSDRTRVLMLSLMKEYGWLTTIELEAALGISHQAVSQQLRILRRARLVRSERRGRWRYYRVEFGVSRILPDVPQTSLTPR